MTSAAADKTRQARRAPTRGPGNRPGSQHGADLLLLGLITCLSLEAALIHAWYIPESFMEWRGYGWFFLACAVGQALYGPVLMLRRTQLVIQAGIWANAGIIALYVVTRLWGVPFGPHAEAVEGVGLFDLMSVAAEIGLVILLTTLLQGRQRRITLNGLMALGVLLWLLRFAIGALLI
jgi:hypothetical protein